MKKKIILAILTVIIIAGVMFLVARTDKQTFISYIVKDDIWEVLEDSDLEKYMKKQKETPYTNKGQITVTTNGFEVYTLGMLQDINWSFEGKNNKLENKSEQQILINSEDDSKVTFRQDNQKIAIQTQMLGSKFVAIENENFKALVEKFGFDPEKVPDKIELGNTDDRKEINILRNKYLKTFNKHLTKDLFSKEKEDDKKVLSMSITEQKTVDIIKDILQQMRDEEINEQLKTEIDVILVDLEALKINPDNKIIIKLYVKSNDVKKYEIIFAEAEKEIAKTTIENTDEQITITTHQDNKLILEGNLSKQKVQKDLNYNISIKVYIEGQKTEITGKLQYKNLLKLNNVEEIYEIKVSYEDLNQYGNLENTSDNMDINIKYLDKKTFDSTIEIEGLDQENAIILNTATNKEMQSILKAIFKNIDLF